MAVAASILSPHWQGQPPESRGQANLAGLLRKRMHLHIAMRSAPCEEPAAAVEPQATNQVAPQVVPGGLEPVMK